jgi:hypothetical protein
MNRWRIRLQELTRSTFALTAGERKALCLVLALALLGLGVKGWHAHQERSPAAAVKVPSEKSLTK